MAAKWGRGIGHGSGWKVQAQPPERENNGVTNHAGIVALGNISEGGNPGSTELVVSGGLGSKGLAAEILLRAWGGGIGPKGEQQGGS